MSYEVFETLCRNHGVKASTVSKATGVSPATLSNWKHGNYTPKSDKLQAIADYFGVSLQYLTTGESEYYINPDTAEKAQGNAAHTAAYSHVTARGTGFPA